VSSAQAVTLTASAGGVAETFGLQLNASGQGGTGAPTLNINRKHARQSGTNRTTEVEISNLFWQSFPG
jgi:hypothetical protein